jgi:hypothetical protein
MDKAMDFLRRELSDLDRLMKALENAMERKQSDGLPARHSGQREETSVFGHAPAHSLWVD